MPLDAAAPQDINNAECPRCAAALHCGILADAARCWCFDMPHALAVPTSDAVLSQDQNPACLCPACLTLAIATAKQKD
ncbi:hypothetical protein HC248_02964 [Polaromonas vacuolata]|uniref:Cysteine-rich CWC n=1 Tax=Polaromonas vacuolata TaxID=37448 RepID=A0A6H2HDH3_9BURK|nr:cysteine-rich CWC family protein [Polaromonas vacuolata]QJC57634.1 hypothetical protein HC248_02964 [Polaromonas vacuolata]